MPTNVTPEYKKAEAAFREARTTDEKIERLEDMISLLPKHKGTDHLFADLKRRLARLREQAEAGGQKTGGGYGLGFTREGAAQVVLVGPPNSGKSSIVSALTGAQHEVGDWPFTTTRIAPGMAPFRDIQIQLVDTPPVTDSYMPDHLLGLLRAADAMLLVADVGSDTLIEDLEAVLKALSDRHVGLVRERDPEDRDHVLCRVLANKSDAPGAPARLELLRELTGDLEVTPLSCADGGNVADLPEMVYRWLGIRRVYTKIPGQKPDLDHPYTVFRGGTVEDICQRVHRDFYESLKFARLWRGTADPITVSRHEPVEDEDILELHL
jgi:ribosome-interacting GTPase 1